jgi:adenylylsulfate kinase
MHIETHARSVAKTLSWRVLATLTTAGLVFAFTGKGSLAIGIGGIEAATKVILYFLHERFWNRLPFGRRELEPAVIWLTGLPASGKTTLATRVVSELSKRVKIEHLDGDSIRRLFPNAGFSRADRDEHVKRVAHLASRLEAHGIFVVVSLVSPYADARNAARAMCKRFIEVYVATPLAECQRRDPKGLYARARRGEISGFTGVDDPYEPPEQPALTINTMTTSVENAAGQVIRAIGLA